MKKTLSFADAIAWMTANPGKEVKSPGGARVRYLDKVYSWADENAWELIEFFDLDDIQGPWTIPEEKLPEVEVVFYVSDEGHLALAKKDSPGSIYFKNNDRYTKCKIKFNQGEE